MDEDQSESAKKFAEFVPELYFDLISRVIPGSVTFTMYLWTDDLNKISSLAVGLVFLFFSYFLGFIADVTGRPITAICEKLFNGYERNRTLMKKISGLSSNEQGVMKKLLAESNLLRVSAVLSLIMAAFPPFLNANICLERLFFLVISIFLLYLHVDSQKLAKERIIP